MDHLLMVSKKVRVRSLALVVSYCAALCFFVNDSALDKALVLMSRVPLFWCCFRSLAFRCFACGLVRVLDKE